MIDRTPIINACPARCADGLITIPSPDGPEHYACTATGCPQPRGRVMGALSTPDLASYHYILINSSAGKDSEAMLTHLVRLADEAGISRHRLIVVHADLGRMEWPGTRELAEAQAAAYGLRFEVVRRDRGDLLDQVEQRGMWPSSTARYCTSDQKTSQVAKFMTRLVRDHQEAHGPTPVRILNCLGIRAQESPARAKKQPFHRDSASNGKRHVDRWLPIFDWSTNQVWDVIRASGLPWHPAYDAGMPRLSCVLCVLAGRRELVLAARLNPELAREYVAVERRIGHQFKADLSMSEIATEAGLLDDQGQERVAERVAAFEREEALSAASLGLDRAT